MENFWIDYLQHNFREPQRANGRIVQRSFRTAKELAQLKQVKSRSSRIKMINKKSHEKKYSKEK